MLCTSTLFGVIVTEFDEGPPPTIPDVKIFKEANVPGAARATLPKINRSESKTRTIARNRRRIDLVCGLLELCPLRGPASKGDNLSTSGVAAGIVGIRTEMG